MKTKYRFIGYWFLYFGAFVLLLLPLAISGFMLTMFIDYPGVNTAFTIFMFLLGLFSFLFFLYISGKSHFQWVIITREELIARCLWKVLVRKKWADIHEVKIVRYPISVRGGFYSRWFVFEDGVLDSGNHNYILTKERPIMIKYNQRSLRIVRQFWKGSISKEETIPC